MVVTKLENYPVNSPILNGARNINPPLDSPLGILGDKLMDFCAEITMIVLGSMTNYLVMLKHLTGP